MTRASILVSYRRSDGSGHVGRLYDALCDSFGKRSVFIDIESITPGADFVRSLDAVMAHSSVLLVVIGPDWARAVDEAGRRRLDDPADFVRQEVARGLSRDVATIPILVHGARMPAETDLPLDLKALARKQAFEMSDVRWKHDFQTLTRHIEQHAPELKRQNRLQVSIRRRVALASGLAVLALSAAAALEYLRRYSATTRDGADGPSLPDLPRGLPEHAEAMLAMARKSYQDAALVRITITRTKDKDHYLLDYSFVSAAYSAFMRIQVEGSMPMLVAYPQLDWTADPIPKNFLDLPAALARVATENSVELEEAILDVQQVETSLQKPKVAVWSMTLLRAGSAVKVRVNAENGSVLPAGD
jgi:hypothetical protein